MYIKWFLLPLAVLFGCSAPVPQPAKRLPNFTVQDGARALSTVVLGFAVDDASGFLLAGDIGSVGSSDAVFDELPIPARSSRIFISRYDAAGKRQSTVLVDPTTLALPNGSSPRAAAFDPGGNVWLLSSSVTDWTLSKLSASGVREWSASGAGLSQHDILKEIRGVDTPLRLAVDAAGNSFVAGRALSGGFFATKFDAAGVRVWSSTQRVPAAGGVDATTADVANNVTGEAGTLFVTSSQSMALTPDGSGGVLVTGAAHALLIETAPPHAFIKAIDGSFVARFDAAGALAWFAIDSIDAPNGSASLAWPTDIVVAPDGSLRVCGAIKNGGGGVSYAGQPLTAGGAVVAFVAAYDSAGGRLWGTSYGGAIGTTTLPNGVAVDAEGNTWIAGATEASLSEISEVGSAFLAGFSPTGVWQWTAVHQGAGEVNIHPVGQGLGRTEHLGVRRTPAGKLLVYGLTTGNLDSQAAKGLDQPDYFVSQYEPRY